MRLPHHLVVRSRGALLGVAAGTTDYFQDRPCPAVVVDQGERTDLLLPAAVARVVGVELTRALPRRQGNRERAADPCLGTGSREAVRNAVAEQPANLRAVGEPVAIGAVCPDDAMVFSHHRCRLDKRIEKISIAEIIRYPWCDARHRNLAELFSYSIVLIFHHAGRILQPYRGESASKRVRNCHPWHSGAAQQRNLADTDRRRRSRSVHWPASTDH
jgi:hypothetical protein